MWVLSGGRPWLDGDSDCPVDGGIGNIGIWKLPIGSFISLEQKNIFSFLCIVSQ